MKQMKHFLSMAALAIVGTIMSSCSSSDEIAKTTQPESKTITQTITVNQDADAAGTRAVDPTTGVKTFVADDKIWVIYKQSDNRNNAVNSSACALSDGGKKATFTVTLSNPKTDAPIRIVYPISMQKAIPLMDFDVTDDDWTIPSNCYDNQDGSIDGEKGLNKHALAVYDGSLIGTDLPTNAMLKNRGTILALTIQNADGSAGIGSGRYGKFNSITITSGITRVEATEEYSGAWPIGKGEFDQSGEVSVEIGGANISTGYPPYKRNWNGEGTSLTFTKEEEGSLTWILTPAP